MKLPNNNHKYVLRYNIISELINQLEMNPLKNKAKFYMEASRKTYTFMGEHYKFSAATIKKWYINYSKNNIDGLTDKVRVRNSGSRKITSDINQKIFLLLEEFPKITAKEIYRKLLADNSISSSNITYCTVSKYVKKAKNEIKYPKKNRLSWEKALAGECVQTDTFKGPIIKINNKYTKTYIISILDDASRLILAAGVYLNDNAENFQKTLKVALKTHGLFKQIYMDNGSPYNNSFTPQICAKLGINCTYTKIYDPSAKGKIERYQKTVQNKWLHSTSFENMTLDEVRESYINFIDKEYNNVPHSSLYKIVDGNKIILTPFERFLQDEYLMKPLTNDVIEQAFIFETLKRINKVGTFKLNNVEYQVPSYLIGEMVTVKYTIDKVVVGVSFSNNDYEFNIVDKVANSEIKRQVIL